MVQNKKENPWATAEAKENRKKRIRAILIGAFAVIMALSMMLPSLSAIFAGAEDPEDQVEQTEAESTETNEDSSEEGKEAEEEELTGLALVEKNYKETIDPLKKKLKESPKDLATLLNLGNQHMSWAYSASSYVTTDEESEEVNKIYKKAIKYYDKYLKLNDSNAVKVDRALCTYYSGDAEGGVAEMKKLTEDAPDYAPAWANLAMLYEMQYNNDEAKEAYKTAIEKDADGNYGTKDYANQRLAAIGASENPDATNTSVVDTETSKSTEGAAALSSALSSTL